MKMNFKRIERCRSVYGGADIEVPEIPPDKRGSLWNACYAVAFKTLYPAFNCQIEAPNSAWDTIEEFMAHEAINTAEHAKTLADIAVWALEALEREKKDGR